VFRHGIALRRLLPSGRAMLDSVRVRLTLLVHGGIGRSFLVVLSLINLFFTFFLAEHPPAPRRESLRTLRSVSYHLDAEVKDQSGPDSLRLAGQVAITEHRLSRSCVRDL